MKQILKDIELGVIPNIDDLCESLGNELPLLNELIYTQQDEVWHAEGDVHTHTDMVLEELEVILDGEAQFLDDDRRTTLILATALHDIAKPITSRIVEIDGRTCVVCPNHEEKGRSYLFTRLINLGIDNKIALDACNLVGYHQMPRRLVMRDSSDSQYRLLARKTDPQLLYYLEKADMKGRECEDMDENLESLELFRMRLEELYLWEEDEPYDEWKYEFKDLENSRHSFLQAVFDFERGKINSPEEGVARSHRLKDGYPELVMTSGISGSGKSTWVDNLSSEWEVVSLDRIRKELYGNVFDQSNNGQVLQYGKELLKKHLAKKKKIVWEATSLRKDHRAALISLAVNYGAIVSIRAYMASERVLWERNRIRHQKVPDSVLIKQIESFQIPSVEEVHELIFCDENGKEFFKSP